MRYFLLIILLAVADLFPGDGEKEGRRGNELYQQENYGPAAEAYRAGLAALSEDAAVRLRYGLENNLGAALLKSGDAAAAGEAFSRALAASPDASDFARTSYNAGNAAYSGEELQKALGHYRESLLRDPDNLDAKFNYEFVKRRLQEQQQQQQQQQQQGDNKQQNQQEQDQNQNGQGQQDQENQDQQQQQDQQEQQDGGEQQQQGQQPEEQEAQEPQEVQPQPSQEKMSEEQAQRILQALQNEEEQLLRQVQRKDARPRKVEKDW